MTETPSIVVEFITARLDEKQRLAEAARPGPWFASGGVLSAAAGNYRDDIAEIWDPNNDHGDDEATTAHIACHDPSSMLADIAAKRQLLELWQRMDADLDSPGFHQAADELLAQLLAPYGKRAVFTRNGGSGPRSWHLEDDPAHSVEG